jgi:hypothetical protein
MNNTFIKALGLVALCYLILQSLSWISVSLLRITQGFGYWFYSTLLPHTWQIAIAIAIIYLLYTATTSRRGGF